MNRIWLTAVLVALAWPTQAFGATVRYIHTDALGSVVAKTDASRNVLERREYEPFGVQLVPATLQDGPSYTGHVQDALTQLTYMQQRYYDPGIGRFLSVDPVTADPTFGSNFNRYWYGNNNPYRFIDPDGRYTCSASEAACGKIDGYVDRLKDARDALPERSSERRRVDKVIRQIGSKGGEGPNYVEGELDGDRAAKTNQKGTTTVDIQQLDATSDPSAQGALSLAHEAQHDIDAEDGIADTSEAVRATETSAYRTEAAAGKGLGIKISESDQQAAVDKSVENWEKRQDP